MRSCERRAVGGARFVSDPTSRLIFEAADARGIEVEVTDAAAARFRLKHGGESVECHESLSERTSAEALLRCSDKRVTSRLLRRAGLRVPAQAQVTSKERCRAFLREHRELVVKPARGEQGQGVSVGVDAFPELMEAIARAKAVDPTVLLEERVPGSDLRMLVIGYERVAAAIRRPPSVVGDGARTILELLGEQSRRRAEATDGASSIPVDEETRRCVRAVGHELEDILEAGRRVQVRGAANVHTGGTIEDVTPEIPERLWQVAERAARALEIPVVGLDLMVSSLEGSEYWIIEANERPGFANHDPVPVAARFMDFLFPRVGGRPRGQSSRGRDGAREEVEGMRWA